jgi:hypothetical protein
MRTRKHDWYDPIKHAAVYGLQVYHDGQWKNCALILCGTAEERDAERKRFRAALRNGGNARALKANP